jgi:hypothetical protein
MLTTRTLLSLLAVTAIVITCSACGDDTRPAGDAGPSDTAAADVRPADASSDASTDAGCIAASARCDRGDTCCGELVCREASSGDGYCVENDDTCFVGARADCCLDDADCEGEARCYGAECRTMGDGVCKEAPAAGECWGNADCGSGMTCSGAEICPCETSCFAPDSPGTCG